LSTASTVEGRVEAEHPGTAVLNREHTIDGRQVDTAVRPAGQRLGQDFMFEEVEFATSSARNDASATRGEAGAPDGGPARPPG
jgi:hypothetical protein